MAEALIKGILSAKLYKPKDIFVSDIKPERLQYLAKEYKVAALTDNAQLAAKVDTLILSVKPQNMADALESIKDALEKRRPDYLNCRRQKNRRQSLLFSVIDPSFV